MISLMSYAQRNTQKADEIKAITTAILSLSANDTLVIANITKAPFVKKREANASDCILITRTLLSHSTST
jgi:hypothetical protein